MARTHCSDFVQAGFHVILIWRGTKVLRRSWPLSAIEDHMRQGVAARRALVDWASGRSEIDSQRLVAFGVSMGGIITSVLLAAEPRLHSGVVVLAGGNLPNLIRVSSEGRLVRWRTARQTALNVDEAELERRLRDVFPSDPLQLAPAVDPRSVIHVTSRYDTVIPLRHQEALWKALGKPLRYDLPCGHYTGIAFLPYVTQQVIRWLKWRLRRH